jgi:hypothetical protein
MSSAPQEPERALRVPERRFHARRRVLSLAYVDVGASHGLLSDISEGGVGVHATASEIEAHTSTVAFHIPGSQERVEIRGQIAWVNESRREAGIRFLDPPETARGRIQEWISLESSLGIFQDESGIIRPPLYAPPQSYHIREVRFDADLDRVEKSWTECHPQFPGRTLHPDSGEVEQRFKHEKENVGIFLLEKGDEIVGAVPFVLNREPLACALGEFDLAKFPMRVLHLKGYTLNMPEEEAAYDRLVGQILRSDFHAIYMDNVKIRSFLWNYLRSSALIRRGFRFYTKRKPIPHLLIRLDGTFESYLKRFSAKARKNRLREIRRLRERGQVNLLRVSQASEIDAFLEAAYDISQRNSKFKRLGWDLAARDPDVVRRKLRFLAERGWLRSYVLKCDAVPCSFILGHQHGSSFYAETVGVDDAWRSYSVGTVILLLVLENLFQENPPEFYDFGTYVKFQEHFATESYPEKGVWLFRRRAYPILAGSIYCACNAVSMATGMLLDRFGLKSKLKQLLWNQR